MKSKEEEAINNFSSGLNCAQSVILAYSEDLKIEADMAVSIASGFGAGMGRLQQTCGAVTGAFMVLGMSWSNNYPNNEEVRCSMIQRLNDEFKSIHGTTECKSLINCDLKTEDGQQFFKENNICELVCKVCIKDSIGIIEELIKT